MELRYRIGKRVFRDTMDILGRHLSETRNTMSINDLLADELKGCEFLATSKLLMVHIIRTTREMQKVMTNVIWTSELDLIAVVWISLRAPRCYLSLRREYRQGHYFATFFEGSIVLCNDDATCFLRETILRFKREYGGPKQPCSFIVMVSIREVGFFSRTMRMLLHRPKMLLSETNQLTSHLRMPIHTGLHVRINVFVKH